MLERYDQTGRRIETDEWCRLMEDHSYRVVGLSHLPRGWRVSTVWLGTDHRFGSLGPPLIFETMVFSRSDSGEEDMRRYSTRADAIEGHAEMVIYWRRRIWWVELVRWLSRSVLRLQGTRR